jgi:hypothetical protein
MLSIALAFLLSLQASNGIPQDVYKLEVHHALVAIHD